MSHDLLLMTPGPSRVPERVLAAGARPMIHHRTPAFSAALSEVLERLRAVYGTERADILPIHTTGRGGMEAAIANLFCAGDEIVACCNGKFGEMWAGIAALYGLRVHRIAQDWSADVDAAEVAAALREHPQTRAITLVYSDTSTGILNNVAAVTRVARDQGVIVLVDCISALGGVPFEFDAWGTDVVVTASQKCLMASPGLAFVAVGERAWSLHQRATLPRSYWDFGAVRKNLSKARPETPGTAPVPIFLQLQESLRMIHEEGLDSVFARHEFMSHLAREGVIALGLQIQAPRRGVLSPTLTPIHAPAGIPPAAIKKGMTERGILVAGGLDRFAETGFRIGHMGDIRPDDVRRTIAALGAVLNHLRAPALPEPVA